MHDSINDHKRICSICNKTNVEIQAEIMICSGCNNKYYCSRECQKSDWKSHKPTCISDSQMNKKYTRMNQNLAEKLSRIVPFMELAASICNLHHDKKTVVMFSFVEIINSANTESWKCTVESLLTALPSITPDGHYSFMIRLGENNTDTKTSMAIPIGICRADCAKVFGMSKPTLPLTLQINGKQGIIDRNYSIVVSDEYDRIIKIMGTDANSFGV